MAFDDRAREAANHARRVGGEADRPDLIAVARSRRNTRLVFSSAATGVALLVLLWASPFQGGEPVAAPTTTTTTVVTTTTLGECPLTIPTGDFVPPSEYPSVPPDLYNAEWHGSDLLWTMVPPEGAVWEGLPENTPGLFTQKVFYWTEGYLAMQDPVPDLVVTATHIQTGETFVFADSEITGGFNPDIGNFIIAGVELPLGCWELSASLEGATTVFVAEVR